MADYQYVGLTAYIKEDDATNKKLAILAQAIEVFDSFHLPQVDESDAYFQEIQETKEYQYLYEHDYVCFVKDFYLPNNTPEAYQNAQLEHVLIKGQKFVRLYVPTVAKHKSDLHQVLIESLTPLLFKLFGQDVVSIKTKSAAEYEDFVNAVEKSIHMAV